ncbi:ACT domain-containing protein [Pseudomassariella vexata]|uniref:ACT domain-domain-containing protein n=1 Tax=Pseudomassariella vexata TaxID=1141098 RepID=A0A1Y2EIF1_9PEZI|nr:ACT domain-containing protein [Pseudomassariella vexata]ORY71217.1 ACT domain-domain-containing protein [Pseudomassariella vexata]
MNSPSQISFLEGTFSLVHIPLGLYPIFLQPILQVLLPQGGTDNADEYVEGLSIDNKHGFLNISITPVECSVVCHNNWAKKVFEPVIRNLPRDVSKTVAISKDSYLILSVISAGMDAGSRVMELTSPLALAGIPIFFITTYYSDFILVPTKDRQTVVQAHARGPSVTTQPPSTPPPSNVAELQVRTFELLKKRDVVPHVADGLILVNCSGRDVDATQMSDFGLRPATSRRGTNSNGHRRSWLDNVDTKLYTSLIAVLVTYPYPRFLSMTLAHEDPPSLLLDKSHLSVFGDSLVGDTDGDLVPIFLDLENLPLEATGIVCGIAGKLVSEMRMAETGVSGELSYLSTARAGAVILSCEQSMKALEVLRPLLVRE